VIEGNQVAQGEYPDEVDDYQEKLQALRMQKSIGTGVRRRCWEVAGKCLASRIKDSRVSAIAIQEWAVAS
jgi:hypothetical protein